MQYDSGYEKINIYFGEFSDINQIYCILHQHEIDSWTKYIALDRRGYNVHYYYLVRTAMTKNTESANNGLKPLSVVVLFIIIENEISF